VRSPLDRLRGYIRGYVSLEGAAIVGLYLNLWFWIGLGLDYGIFKLTGTDWVQELPWAPRAGLLVILLSGLAAAVALKLFTRLFREFRDPALALLLERRFPDVLGDRLITAVELSDPAQAATYGYSPAMVRETIHEAARRVETVPVHEVFDWKRLKVRGMLIALLTLGGYLLVGGIFTAVASYQQKEFTLAGYSDFHDVALLWFERNVLLQDRIWPRRAHLELVDFPESGEVRMGRGGTPPSIRVRALKYVVTGAPSRRATEFYAGWLGSHAGKVSDEQAARDGFARTPPEGWRALSWFDMPDVLGGSWLAWDALPDDWVPRNPAAGLTLDEIELKLDQAETHNTLSPDQHQVLRDGLERVQKLAAESGMSRRLRILQVPQTVTLVYRGKTTNTRSRVPLKREAGNEYTGKFGDLTESVTFTVQGEDYSTASRRVTVVEPPVLETLTRIEERPAYLYYRTSKPQELHGQKQVFEETGVSLQGGDTSRIELPAGSNVVLTAVASKELTEVRIVGLKAPEARARPVGPIGAGEQAPQPAARPAKAGDMVAPPVELLGDGRTFRTQFKDIRKEVAFSFEFTDTDGVTAERKMQLVATEDAPPKVRELAPDDIIRKVKEGYMVTVSARIPFKGKVSDDYGLSDVRYVYTLGRATAGMAPIDRLRLELAVASLSGICSEGTRPLVTVVTVNEALSLNRAAEKMERPKIVETFPLPRFEDVLRERQETPPQAIELIRQRLLERQKLPYTALLSEFVIQPDEWKDPEKDPIGCDFPVWKLNLKITDPRLTQPSYKLEVQLRAIDTDLDGAVQNGIPQPHVKDSDEKFTFRVVSEIELLAEIAKEEEKLYSDLDNAVRNEESLVNLQKTQSKFLQMILDLSGFAADRDKPQVLETMSTGCERIMEWLDKGQIAVREVASAYQKIDKELRTNQVDPRRIDKLQNTIVKPLIDADVLFDRVRDRVLDFRKALDNNGLDLPQRVELAKVAGGVAKVELQGLVDHLIRVLEAMEGLTTINKLIKQIAEIERQEQEQSERIKQLKEKVEQDLFDKALEGDKPKDKTPGKK
jgi:hypothetical protein